MWGICATSEQGRPSCCQLCGPTAMKAMTADIFRTEPGRGCQALHLAQNWLLCCPLGQHRFRLQDVCRQSLAEQG